MSSFYGQLQIAATTAPFLHNYLALLALIKDAFLYHLRLSKVMLTNEKAA